MQETGTACAGPSAVVSSTQSTAQLAPAPMAPGIWIDALTTAACFTMRRTVARELLCTHPWAWREGREEAGTDDATRVSPAVGSWG